MSTFLWGEVGVVNTLGGQKMPIKEQRLLFGGGRRQTEKTSTLLYWNKEELEVIPTEWSRGGSTREKKNSCGLMVSKKLLPGELGGAIKKYSLLSCPKGGVGSDTCRTQ